MKLLSRFIRGMCAAIFSMSALYAADYRIVVAPDASPVEKTAAEEMKLFAGKLLGEDVPVTDKAGAPGKNIYIGATEKAAKLLNVKFAEFADDELIIKSIGGDLYLAGGAKRGTLYAVYEYLERFCGVRFLTPDVNHVPSLKKLPAADFRYKPDIKVRQISMRKNTPAEKLFAARRRLNGSLNHMLPLPDELGGGEHILGCHTFGRFVPATPKGLEKNPEFYAMINGKRVWNAQLCLSNEKLRTHVIEYIKNWLKEHPEATRVSVSMNDYNRFCECPKCKKWLKEHNGELSDILLNFVNDVAAGLEKDFPSLEIVTLAYLHANKPPKVIKPRKNVGIFYCLAGTDCSKGLSHPRNRRAREELEGWRKIGAKIYVWYYSINQKYPYLTQPNWEPLDEDIRTLAKNHSEWLFCEFTYPENYVTDFIRLRFYLMSALQWNQEKSMDELIADFCIPYYGAAAPKIMEALKLMRNAPKDHPDTFIGNFASSVIRACGKEKFLAAWQLMQQARKIAEDTGDKTIRDRVEFAVIPYDITLLHDCFDMRDDLPGNFDPLALLDRDIAIMKAHKITNYFPPKNDTWEVFRRKTARIWGQNDGEIPEGIEKVPGTRVWSAAKFHRPNRQRKMGIIDDPEAFDGKALQVVADGRRLPRLELDNALRGKYRIYLTLKVEVAENFKGILLVGNLWESADNWRRRARPMNVRLSKEPGKGYEPYLMGEAEFRGSYDLQIPVPEDPAIRNIRIDRVIFVPVK